MRSNGFPGAAAWRPELPHPASGLGLGHDHTHLQDDQCRRLRARLSVLRNSTGRHRIRRGLALLAPPPSTIVAAPRKNQTSHGYKPSEVLRSPVFWVMYFMFVLIAAGGLMMAASMAPIAKDFNITKVPVALFSFTMPALVFALSLNRILDGVDGPSSAGSRTRSVVKIPWPSRS